MVKESKLLVQKGVVSDIYEGRENDIVIRLKDHPTRYYINRGTEAGLSVSDLENRLFEKEVIIKYPKYWTPLDLKEEIKHLSILNFEGEDIFNEVKHLER